MGGQESADRRTRVCPPAEPPARPFAGETTRSAVCLGDDAPLVPARQLAHGGRSNLESQNFSIEHHTTAPQTLPGYFLSLQDLSPKRESPYAGLA